MIGDDFLESLPDWRGVVSQIDCPVLLIHGSTSEGAVVSPEVAQEAQQLNPRVEVTMVPSVGHNVSLNARDEYLAAVVPFIERHQRPTDS